MDERRKAEAGRREGEEYLPAWEIDNRIDKSSESVRVELSGAMQEITEKVNKAAEGMALIVGTPQTPGVLSRIESTLGRVENNQDEMKETFAVRVVEDDNFRIKTAADIAELKAKVDSIRTLVAIMKVIMGGFSKVGEAVSGSSPKTIWGILILLAYVAVSQYVHRHFPAVHNLLF